MRKFERKSETSLKRGSARQNRDFRKNYSWDGRERRTIASSWVVLSPTRKHRDIRAYQAPRAFPT
eukprot:1384355-Prymnesium_polylepis.1